MTELEGLPEVVTAVLTPLPGERRNRVRIKPSKPECARPKSRYGHVQELQTTVNISSGGLYFITSLEHYYKGMKLMVTSPFPPEIGEVVRVEQLADGCLGVAVQFLWQ